MWETVKEMFSLLVNAPQPDKRKIIARKKQVAFFINKSSLFVILYLLYNYLISAKTNFNCGRDTLLFARAVPVISVHYFICKNQIV